MTEAVPIRVLVDQSVRSNGSIGQWVRNPYTVNWGGIRVTSEVTELVRRPSTAADQAERKRWIEALPTIARLARTGVLKALTSTELRFEAFPVGNPSGGTVGDLFLNVEFEQVDSPVERSFFHSTIDMKVFFARDTVRDFCRMLLKTPEERIPELLDLMPELSETSRRGLMDLPRFRRLCRHLVDTHYPDLFHWWTADHADCAYFLTMDKTFRNFANGQCRGVLVSKVVDPVQLLEALGVAERDPMPFGTDDVLNYFDAMGDDGST